MNLESDERNKDLGRVIYTEDGSASLMHPGHAQAYHSLGGAKKEAYDLYIAASDFSKDLTSSQHRRNISVLDVGLGLGYNALTTIDAWLEVESSRRLTVVSLECNERLFLSLCSGEAPWQTRWPSSWLTLVKQLEEQAPNQWAVQVKHPSNESYCLWTVLIGDACEVKVVPDSLPSGWQGYNYIWQDPFSQEVNPDMWTKQWFEKIASASNENAKLMTYSVSRKVKDALSESGWQYQLVPTTTSKRSWLRANKI